MATLTVRNVPAGIAQRLKKQAREHNCSMEQEVRNILQASLESRSTLMERVSSRAQQLVAPDISEIDEWVSVGRNRKQV